MIRDKGVITYSLFLAAVSFLLFFRFAGYPFLEFDTKFFILDNPALDNFNWEGIKSIISGEGRSMSYQPVAYLFFLVENFIFNESPFYYHLINVFLHTINAILILFFVLKLTSNKFIAFLTALFFVCHPFQVETVGWVARADTLLFFMFYLLSLLAYLTYSDRKDSRSSTGFYLLSLLSFAFAATSKAAAITLPVVLIMLDLFRKKRSPLTLVGNKIPYILLVGLLFVLNTVTLEDKSFLKRTYSFDWFDHLIFIGHNGFFYIFKTIFPAKFGIFYPSPSESLSVLPVKYYLFSIGAVSFLGLLYVFRRHKIALFGGLYYTLTLAPYWNQILMVSYLPMLVADRYYYQSSLGILLILSYGLQRIPNKRLRVGMCVFLVVVFCSVTTIQVPKWKSEITLYEHLVKNYPSEEFYLQTARLYDRIDEQEKVVDYLNKAKTLGTGIYINNTFFSPMERAMLYIDHEDYQEAIKYLDMARKKNDRVGMIFFNYYQAYQHLDEDEKAMIAMNRFIQLELDTADKGVFGFRLLDIDGSDEFISSQVIPEVAKYVQRKPEDKDASYYLARLKHYNE